MTLRLNGATSGFTEIDSPAIAGSNTLVLPGSNGSAYQFLRNGATAGTTEFAAAITSGTVVASTSGTSIDFTSIPSYVKRVTVMLNGVSTNGTSPLLFQIGTSSGIENSGYVSSGTFQGAGSGGATSTAGFLNQAGGATADTTCGTTSIVGFGSNKWVSSSVSSTGSTLYSYIGAGVRELLGPAYRFVV
jgi:hypothetical protein